MIPIRELLSTPLFAHIEASEFHRYIHPNDCIEHIYQPHSLVAHQGKSCHHLSYVLEGTLIAQQLSSDGKQLIVNTFNSGDFFAAALLSTDNPCYPFNISTTKHSRILSIRYDAIESLLNHSTTFSANYRHFLSEKILLFKNKVELLQNKDVRSRLLTYLQSESLYHHQASFKLRHTKTAIAEMIGVARPSVSRELKNMNDEGLIHMEGKWVELL